MYVMQYYIALQYYEFDKTGNVLISITSRRVCLTNQYYIFRTCVCSFIYPAYKAHAPFNILVSSLPSLPYFSTFSNKCHDFI